VRPIREALAQLDAGRRCVLATVIRSGGSTPQVPGARMLLRDDGTCVGTVGGGAVEHRVIEEMKALLIVGGTRVLSYDLAHDLGMCCGGRMEVFVERIEGLSRLVLLGAGHVSHAVAALAPGLGFAVTVVDDRAELNDETRFPHATRILAEPRDALTELAPHASDTFLIATHDHRLDEEALETYALGPHAYIGLIGSKRKTLRILERIHARRGNLPPLERVYAPVGLALGAITPEEIAVSIASEWIALRHGQSAPHLRALGNAPFLQLIEGPRR
jgi:xanthine dehydrogenase accessory factor